MVLAAITPEREAELRELLDSMNDAPGRVNANNALIRFCRIPAVHVARLLVLKDNSLDDKSVWAATARLPALPRLPRQHRWGTGTRSTRNWVAALQMDCRHCFRLQGFTAETPGRMDESTAALQSPDIQIGSGAPSLACARKPICTRPSIVICRAMRMPSRVCKPKRSTPPCKPMSPVRSQPVASSSPPKHPRLSAGVYAVCCRVVFPCSLSSLPFLIPLGLILAVRLRRLEKTDPELCFRVDQEYSDALARLEDHDVSNQFTAMGSLKPGGAALDGDRHLRTVDYAARHIFNRGRLARIRTIHFARWVFLDDKPIDVLMAYTDRFESYMDDFINKSGFGLNVVFSNGIGYPRTNWLIFDGCADELKYKIPAPPYLAHPGLVGISGTDYRRSGKKHSHSRRPGIFKTQRCGGSRMGRTPMKSGL